VSTAESEAALNAAEVRALFADLTDHPVLVLAISGGPDSTALLLLAARWRKALKRGPRLVAVTVDHGLRKEARREAAAVKRLARSLGVAHRTLRWSGRKPKAGLPEAARIARYRLIGDIAREVGARAVLTAHTLDDQGETVLMRLARGSGISGLAAMSRISGYPIDPHPSYGEGWERVLVRPFLEVPKSRLVATLRQARIAFADDPTNRDATFTRARLRLAMPALEQEGLGSRRLALLARRMRRADLALEDAVDDATVRLGAYLHKQLNRVEISAAAHAKLPAEVALRLLGRAVEQTGNEGRVELGKLEALHAALTASPAAVRFRRTLAGAVVTRTHDRLLIERAPARRSRAASNRP
jgi:tRNA(Ile)-lysidine synthase